MKAWHFLKDGSRLAQSSCHHGEKRVIRVGDVLEVNPPLRMCGRGLHASKRLLDALAYAHGPVICRVEVSGEIEHGTYKLVAQRREVLWMVDASTVLHRFACDLAEAALLSERAAGREPDERSWAAIEAKRSWLRGDIGAERLAAAWAAARDAARDAAWDAARDAARAAWAAARDAAWDASWDASWAAARDAARDAWWDASWAAAWEAARDAQNRKLTAMVGAAHRAEK